MKNEAVYLPNNSKLHEVSDKWGMLGSMANAQTSVTRDGQLRAQVWGESGKDGEGRPEYAESQKEMESTTGQDKGGWPITSAQV